MDDITAGVAGGSRLPGYSGFQVALDVLSNERDARRWRVLASLAHRIQRATNTTDPTNVYTVIHFGICAAIEGTDLGSIVDAIEAYKKKHGLDNGLSFPPDDYGSL